MTSLEGKRTHLNANRETEAWYEDLDVSRLDMLISTPSVFRRDRKI